MNSGTAELTQVIVGEGLSEIDDSEASNLVRLKKIYDRARMAERYKKLAIKYLNRVDAINREVLEYAATNEPILQKVGSLFDVLDLLEAEETGPKFIINLKPLGMNGHIEIDRLKGHFSFNKHFGVSLKVKD